MEMPVLLSVHMPPWECVPGERPFLSVLLGNFQKGEKKQKGKEKTVENGVDTVTVFRLTKKDFFYEKRAQGKILEQSAKEPYGWSVTVRDFSGRVCRKIRYDGNFQWMQTAYYENGDVQNPQAFLLPREGVLRKLWREGETWKKADLLLSPAPQGAEGSLAQELAGEPEAYAWCEQGLFCACIPSKAKKREEVLQDLQDGKLSPEPCWEQPVFKEAAPEQEGAVTAASESFPALEAFARDLLQPFPPEEETPRDYAADHQLKDFQEPAEPEEPEKTMKTVTRYAVAARHLSGKVSAPGIPGAGGKEEAPSSSLEQPEACEKTEILPEPEPQPEQPSPEQGSPQALSQEREESSPTEVSQETHSSSFREDLAVEKENLPEPEALQADSGKTLPSENRLKPQPEESQPEWMGWFRQIPDKLITGKDGQIYAYYGEMKESLRHGSGRTSMRGGHTAYEGGFREDKKDGLGVYYYKSGRLCYAGNWKGNRRQGAGVSFCHQEGTMFAGQWKDNRPEGAGALFDENGELSYVGQWKDGKRHGSGTEYSHGKIVFSGLWENGTPVLGDRQGKVKQP